MGSRRRVASGLIVAVVAAAAPAVAAPTPTLVRDINPGMQSSNPQQLTALGGVLLFQANDGTDGIELWKSDGTAAGTALVKDINPGPVDGTPVQLTAFGAALLFRATGAPSLPGLSGVPGLWKSDGTANGTAQVSATPPEGQDTDRLALVGSAALYAGTDSNGTELWKSDGTAAGTALLKDINPGAASSSPTGFAVVGSAVFFQADDGVHGPELWTSDGTAAGTVLVKDINPGAAGSAPQWLTAFGGAVYFQAYDGGHGVELWKSDGTSAGTALVRDINTGAGSSNPTMLTAAGTTVFFVATAGTAMPSLWTSDGTGAGTVPLFDPDAGSPGPDSPSSLVAVKDVLFFVSPATGGGPTLWATDGTANGTRTLIAPDPNLPSSFSPNPLGLSAVGDWLFFRAQATNSGVEPWISDGTAQGTRMVADLVPGPEGSDPSNGLDAPIDRFAGSGSLVYFAANDPADGVELWAMDLPEGGGVTNDAGVPESGCCTVPPDARYGDPVVDGTNPPAGNGTAQSSCTCSLEGHGQTGGAGAGLALAAAVGLALARRRRGHPAACSSERHEAPMRTALGFAALLLPVTLAVACGSSSTANDAGPLGEGGCLEETPTQGAPCNAGQMLCNPGDLCCGGEWTCDTSTHTWTLLQGRCACFPDSGVPDVSVPSDSGGCPASCPPGQILVDWNTSSPGFPGTSGCACKPNPCPDGGVGCTCSQACQQTISNGTSCCNWTGPVLYCNGCG